MVSILIIAKIITEFKYVIKVELGWIVGISTIDYFRVLGLWGSALLRGSF